VAPNVLFVTLDQFRGDSLSCLGHPVVRTPHLDALAAAGTHFTRHYTQSTPCAPGRAGLYTGMYQMNHRVVANGTPLDERFDNVARLARRAGYRPCLFGYTDQSIDPRVATGPDDPRLLSYEGLLPGMDWKLDLSGPHQPWVDHLDAMGHDVSQGHMRLLATENERPAEHGLSAFMTDRIIDHLTNRADDEPWFVHASYLRPHPPYSAPGHFSSMYDPDDVGLPIAPAEDRHPFHDVLMAIDWVKRPPTDSEMRHVRAQYYGMISEVDHHIGRVVSALRDRGDWENTIVVITADHGEQLGDHGLREKVGFFEQSYHIVGVVRAPHIDAGHGRVVDAFTENVDILPTLCELIGAPIPSQCDGRSLLPWLNGDTPPDWRDAATWEYDWRQLYITDQPDGAAVNWPHDRRLERQHLCVQRDASSAYVQFGNGDWLAFDLAGDHTWRTPIRDAERVLPLAQRMLTWRSQHTNRELSGLKLEQGGTGRWPNHVPWRSDPS